MPDYGNINEPGAREQFPNLPHPLKSPGAVTPRLNKRNDRHHMDNTTQPVKPAMTDAAMEGGAK